MAHPFLLHAVLAFSSSHLEYLSGGMPQSANWVATAGYHTQRALRLYADHIQLHQKDYRHARMNHSSGLEEMDALFAACIMLTSLFYHIVPHRSWAVSLPQLPFPDYDCEPGFDWLTSTSGLSILLSLTQFQSRLRESIWLPFISEASRLNGYRPGYEERIRVNLSSDASSTTSSSATTSTTSNGGSATTSPTEQVHDFHPRVPTLTESSSVNLPNVPPHLLHLAVSSSSANIYGPALVLLNPILTLEPTNLNYFGAFISFPSRLSSDFIALLRRKEQLVASSVDFGTFRCSKVVSLGINAPPATCNPPFTMIDKVDNNTSSLQSERPDPDPIALLILGYWFDQIGEVPHWWCGRRGRGECAAILAWLKGKMREERRSCAHGGQGRKMFGKAVEEFEKKLLSRGRE